MVPSKFLVSVLAAICAVNAASLNEHLYARNNILLDGAKSSMVNFQQTVDTLRLQMQSGNPHVAANAIGALVTGLDSQVDNLAAVIAEGLDPITFGLSGDIGNFLLGPIFQSITNGAEVAISNIIGAPIDFVTEPVLKMFSNGVSKLMQQGQALNLKSGSVNQQIKQQTVKLGSINQQIKSQIAKVEAHKNTHKRSDLSARNNILLDGAKSSMVNFQQTVDTLRLQMQSGNPHVAANAIGALVTGLDSQVDNLAAVIAEALDPITFGLSGDIGDFLLGPIFQSITNGAEVAISNIIGAPIDFVTEPVLKMFSNGVSKLMQQGQALNLKQQASSGSVNQQIKQQTVKLGSINQQIKNQIAKVEAHKNTHKRSDLSARNNILLDGAKSSMVNFQQTVDTLRLQMQSGNPHVAANAIGALVTGLDSQVDNLAAVIAEGLDPITFGLSGDIGNFLLGPIFQSITNGAEVAISNIIGAPIDFVTEPVLKMFSNGVSKLMQQGQALNLKSGSVNQQIQQQTVKLGSINQQIKNQIAKVEAHKSTKAKAL